MTTSKRFRLSITNAAEDVPRLLSAYGRACNGEVALILRPTEGRGLVVLLKKEGTWRWASSSSDAPLMPTSSADTTETIAEVKAAQKGLAKAGSMTLRGQWSGHLVCEGEAIRVELGRKLSAYSTLSIVSGPRGWSWTVERTEKWFSAPGKDSGSSATLAEAISAATARAMGLIGEACSNRDAYRRSALDSDYAQKRPNKPAKEGRDPLDAFLAKKRMPKAPPTKPAQKVLTESIQQDALETVKALNLPVVDDAPGARFRELLSIWDGGSLSRERGGHSIDGLEDIAQNIRDYAHSKLGPGEQTIPLSAFSLSLRKELETRVHRARTDRGWTPKVRKDVQDAALEELDELMRLLQSAPALLARTGTLLKFAAAAAESPRCQAQEKIDALALLSKAQEQYDRARSRLTEGGLDAAGVRALKLSVESIALSAAKAGRSCGAGQTALDLKAPATGKAAETGWTYFLHDDDVPDAEEIREPSREVHALLKKGSLRFKAEDGPFLGRLKKAWEGHPKNALLFIPAEGEGFWVGPAISGDGEKKGTETPKPAKTSSKPAAKNRGTFVYWGKSTATVSRTVPHVWERRVDAAVKERRVRVYIEQSGPSWRVLSVDEPYVMAVIYADMTFSTEAEAIEGAHKLIDALDQKKATLSLEVPSSLAAKKADAELIAKQTLEKALPIGSNVRSGSFSRGSWELPVFVPFAEVDAIIPILAAVTEALKVPATPAPTPPKSTGTSSEKERAAYLATPSASTAKKWAKAALAGAGLEASTLSARSHTGHDGQTYVTVDAVILGAETADAQQRLQQIDKQRPRGLSLEWTFSAKAPDAPTARKAKAEKPASSKRGSQTADSGEGLTPEKTALLQQAFSTAISDVVKQLQAGA